jgi:hypothetical protein
VIKIAISQGSCSPDEALDGPAPCPRKNQRGGDAGPDRVHKQDRHQGRVVMADGHQHRQHPEVDETDEDGERPDGHEAPANGGTCQQRTSGHGRSHRRDQGNQQEESEMAKLAFLHTQRRAEREACERCPEDDGRHQRRQSGPHHGSNR